MKQIRTLTIVCALLAWSGAASGQEIRENTPVAVVVQAQEAKPSPAATQTPAAVTQNGKPLLGYSIVLLVGDIAGTTVAEGLSAPARKALSDIKDFLPYKSYRTLDTQWLAGGPGPHNQIVGHLLGSDNQDYNFQLWQPDGGRPSTLTFRLRMPPPGFEKLLLETTFDMRPGETVVVGTSRLQGDKALVVLLTAVSR